MISKGKHQAKTIKTQGLHTKRAQAIKKSVKENKK